MAFPSFDELPFNARPDLTPYLIHLTKRTGSADDADDLPAYDNLINILRTEVSQGGWISWLHEREWGCKGDFVLTKSIQAAFVRTPTEAKSSRRLWPASQRSSTAVHAQLFR
jgi:hypothetical protein